MSRVCGSSQAAEQLRAALRNTLIQLRSEFVSIQNELRNLHNSCSQNDIEVVKNTALNLRQALCRILPEITKIDRELKAYSLFIESVESRFYENTSDLYAENRKPATPTLQIWHKKDDTTYVFDSPDKIAQELDIHQGKGGLGGSCGICAVENVARANGKQITEEMAYNLAVSNHLCGQEGGTTPKTRQELLRRLQIQSDLQEQNIDNIAAAIAQGRLAILSVDARKLYGMRGLTQELHAVVATSLTVDHTGRIKEIIVCDSNAFARGESGAKRYSVQELEAALTKRSMNVTEVIR